MARKFGSYNKLKLKTPDDLKHFIIKVITDLHHEKISESKAKTFGYLANCLTKIFETVDLADNVKVLMDEVEGMKKAKSMDKAEVMIKSAGGLKL